MYKNYTKYTRKLQINSAFISEINEVENDHVIKGFIRETRNKVSKVVEL